MYPAFATKRPRLPSILSVNQPLDLYRESLRAPAAGMESIAPLDAFLVHMLLEFQPGKVTVVDGAAAATWGTSCLLASQHPHVQRMLALIPRGGDIRAVREELDAFLLKQEGAKAPIEWISERELAAQRSVGSLPVVFLHAKAADKAEMGADVEQWLKILPDAVVLIFGLGAIGSCPALDALVRHFPSHSRHRLALVRDCGEALAASGLGLLAARAHSQSREMLERLTHYFTSNFTFLGLVRSATEHAIRATASDADVMKQNVNFIEWNEDIKALKQAVQQAAEREQVLMAQQKALDERVAEQAAELFSIQRSMTYRLATRVRHWRAKLAPDHSWRFRAYSRTRRAMQIWRREGSRELIRRVVLRGLRRSA